MKLSHIVFAAFLGLVLGTNIALAMAHEPSRVSFPEPAVVSFANEIPSPPEVTTLHETVITGSPQRRIPQARKLTWRCGEPRPMDQGPVDARVRECSWQ